MTPRRANDSLRTTFYMSYGEAPRTEELTYSWICPHFWNGGSVACDVSRAIRNSEDWTVYRRPVQYCLVCVPAPTLPDFCRSAADFQKSQLEEPQCKVYVFVTATYESCTQR